MSDKVDKKDKKKKKDDEPNRTPFRELADVMMYGLCLLLFFKAYSWQNFQIPTSSMENTLLIGDHITANTFIFKPGADWEKAIMPQRDPKRGDVIVFKFPGAPMQDWIKRCIALPGDNVEIRSDAVFINGKQLDEKYTYYKPPKTVSSGSDRDPNIGYRPIGYYEMEPGLANAEKKNLMGDTVTMNNFIERTRLKMNNYRKRGEGMITGQDNYDDVMKRLQNAKDGDKIVIPEGFYLMMGDNRNRSLDGRAWGLVPREFIQGRAYFVWWSYGEDENSHEARGWDLIKLYLRVPLEFFKRTHWEETFSRVK